MKIKNIRGYEVKVNFAKYAVKWDKPAASKIQTSVKQFFKKHWYSNFVVEEMRIPGSLLRIDLYNITKSIIVETMGQQHNLYNRFMHGSRSGYLSSIKRDCQKIKWAEDNNIRVIEINYDEIDLLSVSWIKEKFGISII